MNQKSQHANPNKNRPPRHRAREFALQGIYQWLLNQEDTGVIDAHIRMDLKKQMQSISIFFYMASLKMQSPYALVLPPSLIVVLKNYRRLNMLPY